MDFQILDDIKEQIDIVNWLLLYCAEETIRKTPSGEHRDRRKKQFAEYKQAVMPDFKYSNDFHEIVERWGIRENEWYARYSEAIQLKHLPYYFMYRLQAVFARNHKKMESLDNKEFLSENQKLLRRFLNSSKKFLNRPESKNEKLLQKILNCLKRFFNRPTTSNIFLHKEDTVIKELMTLINKYERTVNLADEIYSADYKLSGKDWKFAKKAAIVVLAGWGAGVIAGPIIGGYIGNLAGLRGAAAINYGLASLGGGSLASGGLGMVGGRAILGLGVGANMGIKQVQSVLLEAQISLSPILAIGRIQLRLGDTVIPKLIHNDLKIRLTDIEDRLKTLKRSPKKNEKSIPLLQKTIAIYRKAHEMSREYNWRSGYDYYRRIKFW